jgi:preprotein translocase subunit YajC
VQGNIDFLAAQQQTNPLVSFLPLILIVAAFYFFLIRPQNKRRREQAQMQNAVDPGSRILTTQGMYATVTAVEDDHLVLEIAPGVEVRVLRQAIMQVLSDDEDTEDTEDVEDTEDTGADTAGAEEPKGDGTKSDQPSKSEGKTPEQPSA